MANDKTIEELKRMIYEYTIEISPKIMEEIIASPYKKIEMGLKSFANAMGPEFKIFSDATLYYYIKVDFFTQGIVVDTETSPDGEKLLVMRERVLEDALLSSFFVLRYRRYAVGLESFIPILREEAYEIPDKKIEISVKDMKDKLATEFGEFASISDTSIYWGVKFVLFIEGLYMTQEKNKEGAPILIIRKVKPGDKLPKSLETYMPF